MALGPIMYVRHHGSSNWYDRWVEWAKDRWVERAKDEDHKAPGKVIGAGHDEGGRRRRPDEKPCLLVDPQVDP